MGVEKGAAGVGVGDDAVGHAVEGVALGPGRLGEDVELAHVRRGRGRGQGRRRAVAAGADEVVEDLVGPVEAGEEHGPVDGGGAGGYAVVGGGVALGEGEALAAAVGAAGEVGVLGGAAVEVLDYGLAYDGLHSG